MRSGDRPYPCLLKNINSQEISSVLFYVCLWTYTFCLAYRDTTLLRSDKKTASILLNVSILCVYVSIANIIFFSDYTIKQLFLIAAILGVFYISFHTSHSHLLFRGFAIVFSAKRVNWEKFFLRNVCFYLFLLASVFLCYRFGLLTGFAFTRSGSTRTDIGFSHPNVYGAYLMVLCIAWMVLRYDKLKIYDYLLFSIVAVYNWIGPNSRASTLIIVIMILVLPAYKYLSKWIDCKGIRIFFSLSYPMAFIFSLICSVFYDENNHIFYLINSAFSGRIDFAHSFVNKYSPTLFGQKLQLVSSAQSMINGKTPAILDNAYIRIFLESGILSTILFLGIITLASYKLICNHQFNLLLGLCLFSIYGIIEYRISKLYYNFLLLTIVFLFQAPASDNQYSKTNNFFQSERKDFTTPFHTT